MDIGIAGSGPAAEAARAAFADVDATVRGIVPADADEVTLAVVAAPAGNEAFRTANGAADRWIAVEIGGLGERALADVDAAVSVFDGEEGCFDCLRRRVASTVGDGEAADRPAGDRSAVRLAGAVAGRRGVMLLAGESVARTVVEVPGPERSFLPAPGCPTCGRPRDRSFSLSYRESDLDDALERAERALDDRVGALLQVGERESFPVPYYLAQTADTTAYSEARAAEWAAGSAAGWDEAFVKALGEGLERYCAGVYRRSELATAPASELADAVPPSRFVRPNGARTPDSGEAIPWVEGRNLETGGSAMLPADAVHFPPPTPTGERFKPAITTGLGLGNSSVEAVLSGLYEVIERDATMLAWYSAFEPLALTVSADGADDSSTAAAAGADDRSPAAETYETLVGRARAEDLSVTSLLVTQDVDVPVVATAVHREDDWPRFAAGSGADLDAAAAATDALAEALQNWMELRGMGSERAAREESAIGEYASFPDAARSFLDADRSVAASDLGGHRVSGESELAALLDRVGEVELDAYAARLTTRDVGRLGFEGVRVVVPGAQPLFTGDPFFGERAERVPRSLGFEPRLDRAHHPFP